MFPYIPYIGWVLEQSHTAIPAKDGVVISSRTDLFSLGIVLFQAPTGRRTNPNQHPRLPAEYLREPDLSHLLRAETPRPLADLVMRIGEMTAYQQYNIRSPLDGEAAMWADLNAAVLPTDARDLKTAG